MGFKQAGSNYMKLFPKPGLGGHAQRLRRHHYIWPSTKKAHITFSYNGDDMPINKAIWYIDDEHVQTNYIARQYL